LKAACSDKSEVHFFRIHERTLLYVKFGGKGVHRRFFTEEERAGSKKLGILGIKVDEPVLNQDIEEILLTVFVGKGDVSLGCEETEQFIVEKRKTLAVEGNVDFKKNQQSDENIL
jgi:hypothetical protein